MKSYSEMMASNATLIEAYTKMVQSRLDEAKEKVSKKDVEKAEKTIEKAVDELDESVDPEDEAHGAWMDKVKSTFPDKKLKFKNRIESGTHTTSAEVSGEDRSYGVWDHDEKKGHIFTEEKLTDSQMAKREEIVKAMKEKKGDFTKKYGNRADEVIYATATKMALKEEVQAVPSKLKHFGRIFDTFVFSSPDAANEFMSSEAGKNHGYLGKDESGYHCANNDDQGTTA